VTTNPGDHQTAIKHLIEERFDAISKGTVGDAATNSGDSGNVKSEPEINGHTPPESANDDGEAEADGDEGAEIEVATGPAKKKAKTEGKRETSEDADARLAAELQAQEEKLARGRTTRGGNSKAKPTKKATKPKTKAKSAKRVRDEDDSGMSGTESGAEKPKKKAGGGFQKPFNLSYPLAELCGENQVGTTSSTQCWRGKNPN
jgi:upstream activation factor subunit UAF30